MRVNKVTILKPFRVIDIETGDPVSLKPGQTYEIEHARGVHPLDYYVVKGTRQGCICRHWEASAEIGVVRLHVIAQSDDPTLDGVVLPITSSDQLTADQKTKTPCGYIIKGKFHCTRCAAKHDKSYPKAVSVFPINIIPYSQVCRVCDLVIFNIWQSAKGGPLCIF